MTHAIAAPQVQRLIDLLTASDAQELRNRAGPHSMVRRDSWVKPVGGRQRPSNHHRRTR
jgi:hypothetical protein